jgi:hypothetical protein
MNYDKNIFIGQNKELFFMHVLKKDVLLLCASCP